MTGLVDFGLRLVNPLLQPTLSDWLGLNTQNSNTVVKLFTEAMGLKNGVDNFIANQNLDVPGYENNLEHTVWDKTINGFADALVEAGMSVSRFTSDLAEAFGVTIESLKAENIQEITDLLNLEATYFGSQSIYPALALTSDLGITVQEFKNIAGNQYLGDREIVLDNGWSVFLF